MKQIIQSFKSGKMEIAEVPVPQPSDGFVVVKIINSLISAGTEKMLVSFSRKSMLGKAAERPDLVRQVIRKARNDGFLTTAKKVLSKLDTPIPLGYSAAGIVVSIGKGVSRFRIGDRVAVAGAGYANHAEYDAVPENLVNKIPDNVSFEDAAFTTVASIAMQGVRRADSRLGETVAVLGLGLLGQITVMILKAAGCRVIGFDPNPLMAELAIKNGADIALSSSFEDAVLEFTSGYGADSVIITAAAKTNAPVITAGEVVKNKGRVVMVGLTQMEIPRDIYYKKELEFLMATSYGPGRYDPTYEEGGIDYPFPYVRWTEGRNMEQILLMLSNGSIKTELLKTHNFDIEDAVSAYDMIENGKERYIAVLLSYKRNKENSEIETKKGIVIKKGKAPSGKIKLGFIGAGNFARSVLIPHFAQNNDFYLSAIVSAGGYSGRSMAEKFKIACVYSDVNSMFDEAELDAVVITTRHNLHAEQIIKSLKKGIHVFTEKPLALELKDLYEIKKCAEESGAILHIGFNRRFSPVSDYVSNLIPENMPCMISYSVNSGKIPDDSWIHDPEIGGGRIKGEVCHFVDLISKFANGNVKSVSGLGLGKDLSTYRTDDNIEILLEYDNGNIGRITYHAMGNDLVQKEKIEIVCGKTMINVNNFCDIELFDKKRTKKRFLKQEKGFKEEISAFAEAVKTQKPAITLDSILNTTLSTFAVEKAILERKSIKIDSLSTPDIIKTDR